MIEHSALKSKEVMNLFLAIWLESIWIVLDFSLLLLLCFLNLELFLNRCWRDCCLISITFFLLSWFSLSCLRFWYFSLLCPLFVKTTITEYNEAIFSIFEFKLNSKVLLLGMLCLGQVICNMLIESRHCRFVLDQNFYSLFPSEFDSFARGYFWSCFEYHFSLLFRVLIRVGSQVLISFNKVPTELNSVLNLFVEGVLGHSKKRTLDCSH